jgi:acetylornithine deacetylase/succinyl-diaminopimelate desuccinylase-like protein
MLERTTFRQKTANRRTPRSIPRPSCTARIDAFVEANQDRLLDELKTFLRIPSISTLPERRADTVRAAEFVASQLRSAGLENVELIPTGRHPLVYADWLHAPGRPTVLCYGHYDVQPADPLELWEHPPFDPVVRDGNIYARGASDDKGQLMTHIKAVEALRAVKGSLPVNVRFLVEGEEEIGGTPFQKYVARYREKLKADVALVSDTALWDEETPALCVGLRGLVYLQVRTQGPDRDVHSGLFGGIAQNAVFGLIQLLAKAKDEDGMLRIPGAYDDIEPPSALEQGRWARLAAGARKRLKEKLGIEANTGAPGSSLLSRIWAAPSMDVHGIAGWRFRSAIERREGKPLLAELVGIRCGYTGSGVKTAISSRAAAKLSFRLAQGQNPAKLIDGFRRFVEENAPKGIKMSVQVLASSPPVRVEPGHPAVRIAAQVLESVFGKPPVYVRSGGSIPIVAGFAEHLGIPSVLMGFGLPGDGLHSPNEKFGIRNFHLGISAVAGFLERYGQSGGGRRFGTGPRPARGMPGLAG